MRGNNSDPEPKGTETDQLQPEKKSSFLDFLQQAPISGFPVTVFGLLIMAAICIVFFVINPIIGLCILGGMVCSVATLQIFRDNNPAKTKMDRPSPLLHFPASLPRDATAPTQNPAASSLRIPAECREERGLDRVPFVPASRLDSLD